MEAQKRTKKELKGTMYDVSIKLISTRGNCPNGHKIGDQWICTSKTPEGICANAFHAFFDTIWALHLGVKLPFLEGHDGILLACPDPHVQNVFEVKRARKAPLVAHS